MAAMPPHGTMQVTLGACQGLKAIVPVVVTPVMMTPVSTPPEKSSGPRGLCGIYPHAAITVRESCDGEIGARGARHAVGHSQHRHGENETLHMSSSLVVPPQYLSDITPSITTQARIAKYVSEMRRELEEIMPEVVVYMLEGRSLDQKRGLIKDITAAVVKNAGAQPDAVTVSLVESPKDAKGKGGVLFSEMPSR
jgi:4-oxalocrotonate tautomerase